MMAGRSQSDKPNMSRRSSGPKSSEARDFRNFSCLAIDHRGIVPTSWAVVAPLSALAQEGGVASPPLLGNGELPRDLSPWGMFLSADVVVKAVLITLVLASIVTWTVWLAKTIELVLVKRRLRKALISLAAARSMAEAARQLDGTTSAAAQCIGAAVNELQLCDARMEARGVKERVASHLERIEAASARRASRGTGVLATIGATAPFVGLFGTVWGIMNSFVGIARSNTTNLAVVAPGIAEALLATACGLAAAIPAVVIYNIFARSIASYRLLVGDASAEILRLVSRDFERATAEAVVGQDGVPATSEGQSS